MSSRIEYRWKTFCHKICGGINILVAILGAILNNGKGSSGNHGEFYYVIFNSISKVPWKIQLGYIPPPPSRPNTIRL